MDLDSLSRTARKRSVDVGSDPEQTYLDWLTCTSFCSRLAQAPALLDDVLHVHCAVENSPNLALEGVVALGAKFVHVCLGLALQLPIR